MYGRVIFPDSAVGAVVLEEFAAPEVEWTRVLGDLIAVFGFRVGDDFVPGLGEAVAVWDIWVCDSLCAGFFDPVAGDFCGGLVIWIGVEDFGCEEAALCLVDFAAEESDGEVCGVFWGEGLGEGMDISGELREEGSEVPMEVEEIAGVVILGFTQAEVVSAGLVSSELESPGVSATLDDLIGFVGYHGRLCARGFVVLHDTVWIGSAEVERGFSFASCSGGVIFELVWEE